MRISKRSFGCINTMRVYIHDCYKASPGLSCHDYTSQALFRAHMGNLGRQLNTWATFSPLNSNSPRSSTNSVPKYSSDSHKNKQTTSSSLFHPTYLYVYLCLYIYLSVCLFVCPSIYLSSIHLSVHPLVYPSIHPSIHPCIHPAIHVGWCI